MRDRILGDAGDAESRRFAGIVAALVGAHFLSRVAGVVTVEDGIERTLDIEGNVSPFVDDVEAFFSRLARSWPVYAIVLAVFLIMRRVAAALNELAEIRPHVLVIEAARAVLSPLVLNRLIRRTENSGSDPRPPG